MGLFMLSGLLFSLVSIPIRIIGDDIPSLEKVFFRNIFGLVFMLIFLARTKRLHVKTNAPYLQLLRGLFGVGAMSLSFYAVEHANLATVTSITFVRPILVTFGAIFIFGEYVGVRRWIAMIVGFLGVLITTGFSLDLDKGVYAMMGSVLFMSMVALILKKLSTIDRPEVTVFLMGTIATPVSLLLTLSISTWVWPNFTQFLLLLSIGICASISQLCFAHSFKYASLGELFPYDFLRLVWAMLIGIFLFSESFQWHVLIGGMVILSATIYVSWRNAIKKPA